MLDPKPPAVLDATPDDPPGPHYTPGTRPEHLDQRNTTMPPVPEPAPVPAPKPGLVDRIAAVRLFTVPGWLVILSAALAWALAAFTGIDGVNLAAWAGADHILTVGEAIQGLLLAVGGGVAAKAATPAPPADPNTNG